MEQLRKSIFKSFLIWMAIAYALNSHGQIKDPTVSGIKETNSLDTTNIPNGRFERLDTVKVYYTIEGSDQLIEVDSTLKGYEHFNPLRRKYFEPGHLGNLGSPTFQLIHEIKWRRGFQSGFRQFDDYQDSPKDIRYFQGKKPFTDLFYTQATQPNANLNATFAHNITPNHYFYIDYNLINSRGTYQNQSAMYSNVSTAFRFRNDKNYSLLLTYIANNANHSDNGGFENDVDVQDFVGNFQRQSIDVQTVTAKTIHHHDNITLRQSWLGLGDSSSFFNKGAFIHEITYENHKYRFADSNPDDASTYYGDYLVNPRGLRNYLRHRRLRNALDYDLWLGGKKDGAFNLIVGLEHHWDIVKQDPDNFQEHHLFVKGKVSNNKRLSPWFFFHADGQFDLLTATFGVKGSVEFKFKQFGVLTGEFLLQNNRPGQVHQLMYLSENAIWDNQFNNITENTIGASYSLPQFNLSIGAKSHLIAGHVYFDANRSAQQTNQAIAIVQGIAEWQPKIWKFHLENQIVWQSASNSLIRLPQFNFRHNLYFKTLIFKKLNIKIGAILRYNTSYTPYGYFPASGQFYLQDVAQSYPNKPYIDAYLALRVKRFRFFVMGENLLQETLFEFNFPVAGYPVISGRYYTGMIRIGASWRLLD